MEAKEETATVKAGCAHDNVRRQPEPGEETRSTEDLARSLDDEADRLERRADAKQAQAMATSDPTARQQLQKSAKGSREGAKDKRFEAHVARDTNAREVSVELICVECGVLVGEYDVVTGSGVHKEVKRSGSAVSVDQLYKEIKLAPPNAKVHLAVPGDGIQRKKASNRFVRSGGRKMTNKGAGYDRLIQEH